MDQTLYEMIFRRKSFHTFRNCGDEKITASEKESICEAWKKFPPLHPEIRTAARIVPAEETACERGQEYCILLYSETKDHYLQNIGYLGEQLDLWLVSKNIGTLWLGIGKAEEKSYDGLDFVIMIAIRKISDPSKYRRCMFRSKRKELYEIWEGDLIDGVSDIIRFAPSACNTQPWFVKNDGQSLSIYRYKKPGKRGIMPADRVSYYNQIDLGIFLCFMELCLEHQNIPYERELYHDEGSDAEMTWNAVYRLREGEQRDG